MLSDKLIYELNNQPVNLINFIDIGCHQGVFMNTLQSRLNKNINSIGIDAVDHGVSNFYNVFLNIAIDNVKQPTTKKFNIYNESGCNSLLELNKDILTQTQSEYDTKWFVGGRDIDFNYTKQEDINVQVNSMFNVLSDLKFNDIIHFVKIDTQGTDVNTFLSFESFIPKIKFLQIESVYTHNSDITLYKNQIILEEDDSIIKSYGFEILDILNWGENKDQCPEADIIYYNKNLV
jgi:hypothetical protein